MLLRKSGTASATLSIALLVAMIASTNSIANYLSLQSQALGSQVNPGRTIIILSKNAVSLTDSKISTKQAWEIAGKLEDISWVKQVAVQKILTAKICARSGNATVQLRFLNNVADFMKMRNARLNGTIAENSTEANMGEILARALSVNAGEEITLNVYETQVKLRISGIFRSQTEIDSEIIAQMQLLENLTGNSDITLIELTLTDKSNAQEAISQITRILPENLQAVQAQQPLQFIQQISWQTLNFITIWSITIYLAIAATSYVIANRLIAESNYEFIMLKSLGASKNQLFMIITLYTVVVAVSGAVLGTALGTIGAQVASTIFRWTKPTINVTPFLEPNQIIPITLLTLAASLLGCLYPAFKIARVGYAKHFP
ncbi:MAG: FtsX-like permease family protein [Candidatus Bathyarchaeia archaeon]